MTPSTDTSRMCLRLVLLGLLLLPASVAAQTTRALVTETSVTWGRGGFAYQGTGSDAVAIADIGFRWTDPSGRGRGLSLATGYDAPNEAFLAGVRGRYSRIWDPYRWEVSLAVLSSSLDDGGVGGIVGLAFYPRPWGALLVQLDLMPTAPQEGCRAGETCGEAATLSGGSDFALSYGVRIAERPAILSWLVTGVVGLAAWATAGELGCC